MTPKPTRKPKSYKEYREEHKPQSKTEWSSDDITNASQGINDNFPGEIVDSIGGAIKEFFHPHDMEGASPVEEAQNVDKIQDDVEAMMSALTQSDSLPQEVLNNPEVLRNVAQDWVNRGFTPATLEEHQGERPAGFERAQNIGEKLKGVGKLVDDIFTAAIWGDEASEEEVMAAQSNPDKVEVKADKVDVTSTSTTETPAQTPKPDSHDTYHQLKDEATNSSGATQNLTNTTKELGESQEDAADEVETLGSATSTFGGIAQHVAGLLGQVFQQVQQSEEQVTPELSPTTPTGHKPVTPTSSDSSTWQPATDTEVHTLVKYDVDKTEVEAATAEAEQPVEQPVEQTVTTTINTELGTPVDTSSILPEDTSATIDVNANVEGTEDVDALNTAVDETEGKKVDVKANVAGEPQVRSLISAISSLSGKIVPVVANTGNSISQVRDLAAQINSLPPSRTITITTIQQTINKGSTAKAGAVNGTAHAMGTAHAKGKWGLEEDENNALINEVGEEIVVILLATLHGDVYVKSYLIAGKSLESYKLQHNHEIWVSVNV